MSRLFLIGLLISLWLNGFSAAQDVTSLRLRDGLEIRIAAPEGWFKRDVTQNANYPSNYFFQDRLSRLDEGVQPQGAFIQVSLVSQSAVAERIGTGMPPADVALAYVNSLLTSSSATATVGRPAEFTWGDYPALILPLMYEKSDLHGGRTACEMVALALDGRVLLMVLYAPPGRWSVLDSAWRGSLSSLIVNGENLPTDALFASLDKTEFSGG